MSDDDFKYLYFGFGSKNLELLKEKGAYPYGRLESFKKFSEGKLLGKKDFYSSVKDETAGDNGEDQLTCKKIWNEVSMKNMGDYHDHYLKKYVLLLADAFEKFTDTCFKFYKLDPCHYFSSPGLSLDAMLKMTGVKFKSSSGIDMFFFIEKGLRGGMFYIAKK